MCSVSTVDRLITLSLDVAMPYGSVFMTTDVITKLLQCEYQGLNERNVISLSTCELAAVF